MFYKRVGNRDIIFSPFQTEIADLTRAGLKDKVLPTMTDEGTGGTYFMRSVAVFKPADEEAKAKKNPRNYPPSESGSGYKKGTKAGHGAYYEVAAYALDHPKNERRLGSKTVVEIGFSGVPPTILVACNHASLNHPDGYTGSPEDDKFGSLQMFMKSDGSCADIGPNRIGLIPDKDQVHKITVLDIRMANADRHGGNILCREEKGLITELIPIDHGCCLPYTFEDCTFVWLDWPQAKVEYSQDTINYIKSLDAEEDIKLLKHYGWDMPVESQRTLRISTKLLQKGVDNCLTPYEIGSFMCRTSKEESKLEKIITEAQPLFDSKDESIFLKSVYDGIDDLIHKHITANKTPK